MLSQQQLAFDAAVRAWNDFDYPGIADLDQLRTEDPSLGEIVGRLTEIREQFNAALAVEGQRIRGHAPHPPFHLDYLDSPRSNAKAFSDGSYSFIGVTIPLVGDVVRIALQLADSPEVVARIGLPFSGQNELRLFLFQLLVGFICTHEYSHHVHGHLSGHVVPAEEIAGGSLTGSLAQQAREADADGYAAYFVLAFWVLDTAGRAEAVERLNIQHLEHDAQDTALFSSFLVAQAAFSFLREPEPLDRNTVYRRTHPPQPVRLQLMSRFAMKWCAEFRPTLRSWMTQARYQSLMDAVSAAIWTAKHAERWRAQDAFLRSPDGLAYVNALVQELDAFRQSLNQWEPPTPSGT